MRSQRQEFRCGKEKRTQRPEVEVHVLLLLSWLPWLRKSGKTGQEDPVFAAFSTFVFLYFFISDLLTNQGSCQSDRIVIRGSCGM